MSVCLCALNYLIRIKLSCQRSTQMAICVRYTSIASFYFCLCLSLSLSLWKIVLLYCHGSQQSAMFAQLLSCVYLLCLIAPIKIGYLFKSNTVTGDEKEDFDDDDDDDQKEKKRELVSSHSS